MKINVSDKLPAKDRATYTPDNAEAAPEYIRRILAVPGVKSVFRAADFIAVDRTPKGDWQTILTQVRETLSGGASTNDAPLSAQPEPGEKAQGSYGEVQVLLQTFRGIPLQVRVSAGTEQMRAALPDRFEQAAMHAGTASPNLIKERRLEDLGIRYGELQDVLDAVVQEIDAAYDDSRLEALVRHAMSTQPEAAAVPVERPELSPEEVSARFASPDWKQRYAALQQMRPTLDKLPLLVQALADENASIRRLATVYLGDLKSSEILPYLYRALEDDSPAVRRTAGDTLSDIGDPAAIPAMIRALSDPNKLVRWRAARFLYEVGDDSAVPALKAAENDPEFEVRMQVKMALERIEGGIEAEGSVWQQMTNRNRPR
jgi:hypothetical protein